MRVGGGNQQRLRQILFLFLAAGTPSCCGLYHSPPKCALSSYLSCQLFSKPARARRIPMDVSSGQLRGSRALTSPQ